MSEEAVKDYQTSAPGRGHLGFTLLEVMLATLILAMVVSMVTVSLSGSLRVVEATREQGDLYYRAQVAFQRMAEDFAAAALPDRGDFVASAQGSGGSSPRVMVRFDSLAHLVFAPATGQEGMGEISYALAEDPEKAGRFFLLRSDRLLRPREKKGRASDFRDGFVLCDQLRSLTLAFYDAEGNKVDNWDTRVDDNLSEAEKKRIRRLPAAVFCRLEFWLDQDEETSLSFETEIAIPAGHIVDRKNEDNAS